MERSMVFKNADPKFYKGVHQELFALVITEDLGEDLVETYGNHTEVKVTVPPPEDQRDSVIIPRMDVKIFGPEELESVPILRVLGVKLDLDAAKWLRASSVHPPRPASGISGMVARPRVVDKIL